MYNNQQIQNNNKITIQQAQDIIINGTFYFPAWKHYNQETIVNCDLCHKNCLFCSIGYQTFDLCLECVNLIIHPSINNDKNNDNNNNRIIEIKSNETITIVANKINIISSDVNYHNQNTFQNPIQTQNYNNSTNSFLNQIPNSSNSFQSDNIWNKKQKLNQTTNDFQYTNSFQPTNTPQYNFSLPTNGFQSTNTPQFNFSLPINGSQPTNVFKF